jgi:hypothetical protein
VKKRFPETEWLKLIDAQGAFGISRPEIYRAIIRGDVVGSHLTKPGKEKGIWLVNRSSLDEYIRSFLPGGSRYQKQLAEAK